MVISPVVSIGRVAPEYRITQASPSQSVFGAGRSGVPKAPAIKPVVVADTNFTVLGKVSAVSYTHLTLPTKA